MIVANFITGESSRDEYDVTGEGAFTNRNIGLQYRVAQTLAAASHVLRGEPLFTPNRAELWSVI